MFQRPGKMKRAAINDGSNNFRNRDFFKMAKKLLADNGNDDAAFYMEQMMEWTQKGEPLPTDVRTVAKALGI